MTPPQIAFVLQDALGWSTYRRQLERVLAARRDIVARIIPVSLGRFDTLFHKRNNMSARDHLFRRVDPIDAFAGGTGRKIRAALTTAGAVHFAGHWPAAAIARLPDAPPFTIALDNTRAGIERDLPRGAWSGPDMEREAKLLRAAARVWPMSAWARTSVIEDCGVAPERVSVMPPSLDLSRFPKPGRREPGDGPARIIFIGNDIRRKGAERLAEWVAGPLAGLAELHVVSGDPAAGELSGRAVVHGRVPNDRLIGELLPTMDVLCLPTRSDMSPQVLAEAAAAGLPAVASAIGGIPDMVLDEETGLTVPAADDAGFIAALERLARDRADARRMGEAARLHARENFDADRNFDRLINTLVALAAERQQRKTS